MEDEKISNKNRTTDITSHHITSEIFQFQQHLSMCFVDVKMFILTQTDFFLSYEKEIQKYSHYLYTSLRTNSQRNINIL